jgi:hypothetical protein
VSFVRDAAQPLKKLRSIRLKFIPKTRFFPLKKYSLLFNVGMVGTGETITGNAANT